MKKSVSKADARLVRAGLKKTDFRLALLKIFEDAKRPLSATQLLDELPAQFDRATLFRNLKTLEESGVLSSTDFGTGATFYCLQGEDHHHHVFCVRCEKTRALDLCGAGPMIALAEKLGFQVITHKFELLGLCPSCQG
jgi:Fe2+ or Zn2+ uptake regulation protein